MNGKLRAKISKNHSYNTIQVPSTSSAGSSFTSSLIFLAGGSSKNYTSQINFFQHFQTLEDGKVDFNLPEPISSMSGFFGVVSNLRFPLGNVESAADWYCITSLILKILKINQC